MTKIGYLDQQVGPKIQKEIGLIASIHQFIRSLLLLLLLPVLVPVPVANVRNKSIYSSYTGAKRDIST